MTGAINTNNYESQMKWFQTSLQRSDSEGSASSMTSSSSEGSSRSASPNLYGQLLRRDSFSSHLSDTSYQGDIDSSEAHRPFTRSLGNQGIVSVVQSALVSPLSWVRNLAQNVIDLPFTAKTKNSPKEFSVIDMPKAETTPKASQSSSMKTIFSVAALIGAVVLVGAYFYSSQSSAHNIQLEALQNNHTNALNGVQGVLKECVVSKTALQEELEKKCSASLGALNQEHVQKLSSQALSLNATWSGKLEQALINADSQCANAQIAAVKLADEDCKAAIVKFSNNAECIVKAGTHMGKKIPNTAEQIGHALDRVRAVRANQNSGK